jgi:4-carboxymuconolactone decarboxylase
MSNDRPRGEKFEKGLETRRAVLGDAYVERSLAAADDFTWPVQKLATEYCWDEIWNRPGLDRRSRSLLNLGMLSALNRSHELKAHIRGALNNGVTMDELREVFLQVTVYCGMPAGLESFRLAKEVFAEMGLK